jgi:polyisoprenyl-phosphate glycosyltransferase
VNLVLSNRAALLHNLRVSVVIPVYSGQDTLPDLTVELGHYTSPTKTALGHTFTIEEVLLVWDRGPRTGGQTIRDLHG